MAQPYELRRLRQEDQGKFKAKLEYIMRSCLNSKNKPKELLMPIVKRLIISSVNSAEQLWGRTLLGEQITNPFTWDGGQVSGVYN